MPSNAARGNKRRRDEAFPDKDENSTRINHKLHHIVKEVKRSAKKAKTFETQKLVKKLKALKQGGTTSNDGQLNQLELQLEALKNMDHESIGMWALQSKLKKDKVLSQDPVMTEAISAKLQAPAIPDDSEIVTQVRNRFLSSKTLAADVSSAASALRACLLPKSAAPSAEISTIATEASLPTRKKAKVVQTGTEASAVAEDDEDDGQEFAEEEIASHHADQDDDGWESGSVADSDAESVPTFPGRRTKASGGAATSSTFLPSLSVGYVRGGSDSEYSDDEPEDFAEPKKNRRGQRARRAIWEKKFGKNANHVKKGQVSTQSFGGAGRQPHQKGTGKPRPPPTGASASARPTRPLVRSQAPPVPEVLHPSWEAKRKLKEKQSTAIVPAQGKKITFS